MVAVSRWLRYPISATTGFTGPQALVGTRGMVRGTANTADSFTIPGTANNQIKININSGGLQQITLSSGTNLDPRFIARDMQRKIQAAGAGINDGFEFCQVEFANWKSNVAGFGYGQFIFRSGTTGTLSTVAISAGDSSALSLLGLNSISTENGTATHEGASAASNNGAYTGSVTTSGVYRGAFDDEYAVFICANQPVGTATYGGSNTYGVQNAGVAKAGGFWNGSTNETYTVTISTTNGAVVGGGTGNVPTFTVTSTQSDTISTAQEILFANTPYYVGTRGLTLKFTDAPFANGDTITIVCTAATTADGTNAAAAVGTAKYHYRSRLGDDSTVATTTSVGGTALGRKGITVSFSNSGSLTAKDEFRVICRGPTPEAYGVTSMVYGNVTVTSESPVKVHQFEIQSGAVDMSSVKFSLQSHGTFAHHDAGNSDTFFRFGTAGFGHPGDGTTANNGPEWTPNVAPTDLATAKNLGNTGAPIMLAATVPDLAVVSSADNAENVGNKSLVSDFIWTNIRLGAEESGANSTINYRLYFDYT